MNYVVVSTTTDGLSSSSVNVCSSKVSITSGIIVEGLEPISAVDTESFPLEIILGALETVTSSRTFRLATSDDKESAF